MLMQLNTPLGKFPPPAIPGASYYRFRDDSSARVLATMSGRPPKDLQRFGATYDEIIKADRTGYHGIAACLSTGKIECWEYATAPSPSGAASPSAKPDTAPPAPAVEVIQAVGRPIPTVDDFADLPEQMVQARRWLLWKSVANSDPTKKPRKIPHYANGGERGKGTTLDSPADVANLVTFEDALRAMQAGDFAGLGFALGPDGTGNCWQGVDLDDLPSRPELGYIADILPGYTEQSPSGNGMHAIGYGRPFPSMGSNRTGIETYSAGRFFTVTAAGAGRHPITCLAEFVERQLRPIHGKRDEPQPAAGEAVQIEEVSPKTITELRSALLYMHADNRDIWVRMGHALKKLGSPGRGLWLEWSATSDKFDPANAARTWNGFQPLHTSYQAVFAEAQRQGWSNPLSNEAIGWNGEAVGGFQASAGATPRQAEESGLSAGFAPPVNLNDCIVAFDSLESREASLPHIVDKWIPCDEVTLLAGHGGGGKSYVALVLAALVALGRAFGTLQARRTKVLFFSGEDGKAVLKLRLSKICRALQIEPADLEAWLILLDASDIDSALYREQRANGSFRTAQATETKTLEALAILVQTLGVGLVVVDNASDTFDGNEIVRTQVRSFIRLLRTRIARPGRAVLLLAHIGKAAATNKKDAGTEDYSGSTAWHNSVRSRLSLTTDKDGVVTIEHMKANLGPKAEPVRMEWHDGVPMVAGSFHDEGAEAAASIVRAGQKSLDDADKTVLVEIITDFDKRGERVTTSMQGSYTVFKALKSADPSFPVGMTTDRLGRLLRELEREGRIFRCPKFTPDRKWKESFTCSAIVRDSAPNATAEPPHAPVQSSRGRAASAPNGN